jgi:uncharacterized protein
MNINRRKLLHCGVASLLTGYASMVFGESVFRSECHSTAKKESNSRILSASSNDRGEYFLTITDNNNRLLYQHQLPSRGHAITVNQRHQRIFCISRRPENMISVLSMEGELLQRISTPPERHLYGHAVCDSNGDFLYTTENNISDGNGRIGVWDIRKQTALLTTFSSYGVGPHDIALSHDQQYLIVANGGIRTAPQSGRKKLNIDTMSPSLVFIDRVSGQLHKRLQLPSRFQHNSIRHLATDDQGNVFIALQNQLKNNPNELLLIRYDKIKDQLIPLQVPTHLVTRLQGYIGSIALDHSQSVIGATSPRGNCVLFYSIDGTFLYHLNNEDICGIQAGHTTGEFILSSGKGEIIRCLAREKLSILSARKHNSIYWDNHLSRT